ncbi:MAG: hypothetical protein WC758_07595 [Candidatus Woesearchaeota archaeon]|jgi:hypothetical protein
MDKDFIPKFSEIEDNARERLKNDISKYLPKKEKIEVEKPKEEIKDSHPEEIKNSNLTLDNLKSSGNDNKEKWLDKPNFLGLTKLEFILIALVLVIGIGFYAGYNLGNDGKLSPTVNYNSTCTLPNITIPASPACNCPVQTCSLTCPVQIINITVSNHS